MKSEKQTTRKSSLHLISNACARMFTLRPGRRAIMPSLALKVLVFALVMSLVPVSLNAQTGPGEGSTRTIPGPGEGRTRSVTPSNSGGGGRTKTAGAGASVSVRKPASSGGANTTRRLASVEGTSWNWRSSAGYSYVYEFLPGGKLRFTKPGGSDVYTATWRQTGNTVTMVFGGGAVRETGTVAGNSMSGSGPSYTWTATRSGGGNSSSTTSSSRYNFRGLRVRLIWDSSREDAASRVADRLEAYGADVVFKQIESGTKFPGQIFYLPGYASQAQSMASAISDIESVSPDQVDPPAVEGAQLYLWVVGRNSSSSSTSTSSSSRYNFSGLRVRVMWDRAREDAAYRAGERLKSFGADVIYKRIDEGTKFPGQIFFLPGYASQAQSVASSISDIERVTTDQVDPPAVEGAQLYLWVVGGSGRSSSNSTSNYNFRGLKIRLMWNSAREDAASKVADKLRSLGAEVVFKRIDDTTKFPGQIFYLPGYASQAQSVANAISDIESVRPDQVDPPAIEGAQLYLWVVR